VSSVRTSCSKAVDPEATRYARYLRTLCYHVGVAGFFLSFCRVGIPNSKNPQCYSNQLASSSRRRSPITYGYGPTLDASVISCHHDTPSSRTKLEKLGPYLDGASMMTFFLLSCVMPLPPYSTRLRTVLYLYSVSPARDVKPEASVYFSWLVSARTSLSC
jgi:hypothetical protein